MAWDSAERDEIVTALAVVCEVTGAAYSSAAKQFFLRELETFEPGEVLIALRRCARECTHRLALADVIERIEEEREKNKANRRAALSVEETQLRLAALDARIPWELGKAKVREMLAQSGKGLPAHDAEKERERARSLANAKHWQETEKDE
jgi:hypothetical protein